MNIKTRYSLVAWRNALAWWWPRHKIKALRVLLSLPKAAYYSARGRVRHS